MIHLVHGMTMDRVVQYREIEWAHENWPQALDGYRIAFMSDFHHISDDAMRDVVDELNRRAIDMLLLGGDFAMMDTHYRGTLYEIAQTRTTDGIFGVAGNHDFQMPLFAAMRALGMVPLGNDGVRIREGFFLAGVQDLWRGQPDVSTAVSGAYPADFVLLLTHNPDVVMQQPMYAVDLALAAHTHNGQITFLGFPLYLRFTNRISQYGTRFAHGWATAADGTDVFTTSGVGVYGRIPRIFNPPEVVIITMRRR